MRLLYFLLLILGFGNLNVIAQTVTGKVLGSDLDEGLIGATILVKGTSQGTVTDIDGNYSLKLPADADSLIVSYTGYVTVVKAIGNAAIIDFVLDPDVQLMDEVVVIGYGVQEKKVSTGSISKVSSEDLDGIQVQSVTSALAGQVSGLVVSESSGQPGSGRSILIRGISTNGDNTPLYIVDGLQVSSIDNINPGDVESVDVLKDAASCAIYGARAANGVVIITTKKGTGEGGEVNYEYFTSNSTPWKKPEMLSSNDYITLTREKFANGGQLSALNSLGFPQDATGTANTDWMDVIFNDARISSHRLSASMKNSYISLEYWDQGGVVGEEKSRYKRYSIRVNTDKEINKFLKIGQNVSINRVVAQSIGVNNAFGTVISDAFAYDPLTEVYNDDKQYGFEQSKWVQKEYINPLSRLFLANSKGHGDQVVGNVFAEITPFEGFTFHTDLGIDYSWFNFRSFVPDYDYHASFVNPSNDISQGYGFGEGLQVENYINYKKDFGRHNVDLVLGTAYRENANEWSGGSTSFIPQEVQFNENFQILDAGADTLDLTYGGIGVKYALISYYGRILYNYDKRYLLSATLRRDGSSNFGPANRFGIFPSFSAGWVVSDEPFFDVNPISFLKVRASWGVNGNDRIAPLSYASTIENAFSYPFGVEPALNVGSSLATPPNPNIKWEESVQLDLGLELRLFDDKVTAEVDYYQKNTKDLLMRQVIPGYLGATNNPISNLGEIQNNGVEVALNYRETFGAFKFNMSANYTKFKNEVISIAGDSDFLQGWSWPVRNTPITRMTVGYPVGHFVGYQTDGIFQSQAEIFSHLSDEGDVLQPNAAPGDLKYVDVSGPEGKPDGIINSDDIAHIGSPWPAHIIGMSIGGSWKGFDVSAVFNSQIGHDIFRSYERSDITYTNYQTFWLDRWTEENPSTEFPRLVSNDPNNNQRPSDFYLDKGSFLRLRNFQIGYSLPKGMLKKIHFQGIRIYFSANNLLTVTNYKGFDPDIGTTGWILDTGIDKGFYPSNKSIGFGIKVTM